MRPSPPPAAFEQSLDRESAGPTASLTLAEAAREPWDVVIVGAGPAGAFAAIALARRGVTVLLVDKSPFPRDKVCGCCLNAAALAALGAADLGDLPARLGAVPLTCVNLSARGGRARLPLPGGAGLSRRAFDAALVRAAVAAGAAFLPGTSAEVGPALTGARRVVLRDAGGATEATARLVLAADGLGNPCLKNESNFRGPAEDGSWIGAGTFLASATQFFRLGTIFMACGAEGYVGAIRLEDGRLNVAAALDPRAVRVAGGPAGAAARVAAESDWPAVPELGEANWRGTPALTRRPARPALDRVVLLGDAAGYVEPFTGEGIAWALAAATAVAPLAAHALRHPHFALADAWAARHRELFGWRQARCRRITRLLRFPALLRVVLPVLARVPGLATLLIDRLNRPVPRDLTWEDRP